MGSWMSLQAPVYIFKFHASSFKRRYFSRYHFILLNDLISDFRIKKSRSFGERLVMRYFWLFELFQNRANQTTRAADIVGKMIVMICYHAYDYNILIY